MNSFVIHKNSQICLYFGFSKTPIFLPRKFWKKNPIFCLSSIRRKSFFAQNLHLLAGFHLSAGPCCIWCLLRYKLYHIIMAELWKDGYPTRFTFFPAFLLNVSIFHWTNTKRTSKFWEFLIMKSFLESFTSTLLLIKYQIFLRVIKIKTIGYHCIFS